MINYRKKIIIIILIIVFLVVFKLNDEKTIGFIYEHKYIKLNSSIIQRTVINEKTRIFCMILTQNKSLYNNRVIIHSIFHFFNEKY